MKSCLFAIGLFFAIPGFAQTLSPLTLKNAVDNTDLSLSAFSSQPGLVIIFTSNACPFDEYYRSRIDALVKSHGSKIPVLLVNASAEASENYGAMVSKAADLKLTIPYLADKEQKLMSNLNAKRTPEAFVLKNNGGKFSVIYRGAIDDNPQVQADVRHPYLVDALNKLMAGQSPSAPEVRPVGCNLRKL